MIHFLYTNENEEKKVREKHLSAKMTVVNKPH